MTLLDLSLLLSFSPSDFLSYCHSLSLSHTSVGIKVHQILQRLFESKESLLVKYSLGIHNWGTLNVTAANTDQLSKFCFHRSIPGIKMSIIDTTILSNILITNSLLEFAKLSEHSYSIILIWVKNTFALSPHTHPPFLKFFSQFF